MKINSQKHAASEAAAHAPAHSSHRDHDDDYHEDHSSNHEELEEGEPWLVSYADLMTLLFGFFVLMYSFASAKMDDNSEEWIKVKKEVATFFGGEVSKEKKSELGKGGQNDKNGEDSAYSITAGLDLKTQKLLEAGKQLSLAKKSLDEVKNIATNSAEQSAQEKDLEQMMQALLKKSKDGKAFLPTAGEKGFQVVLKKSTIFINGGNKLELQKEGTEILEALAKQLSLFKHDLFITVECYKALPSNLKSGSPSTPASTSPTAGVDALTTEQERANAYLETSQRALYVMSVLRTKERLVSQSAVRRYAIAGFGYMNPRKTSPENVGDRIVIRVALDDVDIKN